MYILGLQGSPRKKGNSDHLLKTFMAEALKQGAATKIIDVPRRDIRPCLELIVCEKKGYCPIEDDMQKEIYALIRKADVIVMASPVFFYSVTAQLKALIDRCQTLWARKYKLRLADPNSRWRRGVLLSVGATKGRELFTGLELTAKYFFDAVDAAYEGSLTYPEIEGPKDLQTHPNMPEQVATLAERLVKPFANRRRVLFTCQKNDCLSQMAAAMAQHNAGDILEIKSAGSVPAEMIAEPVVAVMAEKGIDMAFRRPEGLDNALENWTPHTIVGMDCWEACPYLPNIERINWELKASPQSSLEDLRRIRDQIEEKIIDFVNKIRQTN